MESDVELKRRVAFAHNARVEALERNVLDYAEFLRDHARDPHCANAIEQMKTSLLESVSDLRDAGNRTEHRLAPEGRVVIFDNLESALRNNDPERLIDIQSRLTCGLKPTFGAMGLGLGGARKATQRPVLHRR